MKNEKAIQEEMRVLEIMRALASTTERRIAVDIAMTALAWALQTPNQKPSARINQITK